MPTEDMYNGTVGGVQLGLMARGLSGVGFTDSQIARLLGWTLLGAGGSTRPSPFEFTVEIAETEADCAPNYARTFQHTDWIDGTSRVQAQQTPEELGFNERFHLIEAEFDAIAAQFKSLGDCLAELRAGVSHMAGELETKLTAMQDDIYDLQQSVDDTSDTVTGVLGNIDWSKVAVGAGVAVSVPVEVDPGRPVMFDPGRINEAVISIADTILGNEVLLEQLDAGTTSGALAKTPGLGVLHIGSETVGLGAALGATTAATARMRGPRDVIGGIVAGAIKSGGQPAAVGLRTALLSRRTRTGDAAAVRAAPVADLAAVDAATAKVLTQGGYASIGDLAKADVRQVIAKATAASPTTNRAALRNAVAAAMLVDATFS